MFLYGKRYTPLARRCLILSKCHALCYEQALCCFCNVRRFTVLMNLWKIKLTPQVIDVVVHIKPRVVKMSPMHWTSCTKAFMQTDSTCSSCYSSNAYSFVYYVWYAMRSTHVLMLLPLRPRLDATQKPKIFA